MLKYKLILILVVFFIPIVNAQGNEKGFEEIAIDYFAEELIDDYPELEYFIFDGNLETKSPIPYSFCRPLKKTVNFIEDKIIKINIKHPKIIKKLNFFRKIFTSKKKISNINVFKNYPKEEKIVVIIYLTTKNIEDYYSILIDKESRRVIDSCRERYYE